MAGVDPETKEKALQWLYDNDVMTVVEKAINEACRQTPSDVNGFMADFFKGSSHPASVAKVEATSSFNAVTGQPQLRCTLYAETCATHRPVSTCIAPTFLYQMQVVSQDDGSNKKQSKPVGNHTPLELVDCEDGGVLTISSAVHQCNTTLAQAIHGLPLRDQHAIDTALTAADDSVVSENVGGQGVAALSLACAKGYAYDSHLPLFEALEEHTGVSTPRFMPRILAQAFNMKSGKLKVKAVYLQPNRANTVASATDILLKLLLGIQAKLGSSKTGQAFPDPAGTFHVNFDRLEQVPELLDEVGRGSNLTLGKDFFFGLDIGASELYDARKDRYDVGGAKDRAELIAELVHLTNERGLTYIADPLRPVAEEASAWRELLSSVARHCSVVFGSGLESRPALADAIFNAPVQEEPPVESDEGDGQAEATAATGPPKPAADGMAIRLAQAGTVSDFLQYCKQANERKLGPTAIADCTGSPQLTEMADLAVAGRCQQLVCGLPCGLSADTYHRLLEIEKTLAAKGEVVPIVPAPKFKEKRSSDLS
eukprot:TRINITY_DN10707_c0_g1_i2.p1 TRINITY_DN10707_c0_g1~~TRINITY_DN10707_c0_g1_i2.p1  ORF type:complete len:540 (+),score=111.56 TRINITY_DN10707_c0_g1_i2:95-1714(+)